MVNGNIKFLEIIFYDSGIDWSDPKIDKGELNVLPTVQFQMRFAWFTRIVQNWVESLR